MDSSKNNLKDIKDNTQENSFFIVILITLFFLTMLLLSGCYLINYYLSKGLINEVNLFSKIKNILLIISCLLTLVNAILILILGFKNNTEDYDNYKNYVMVPKEVIKEYQKEIKELKNKLHKESNFK